MRSFISGAALAVALTSSAALATQQPITSLTGPTGTAGTDFYQYKFVPANSLVRDETIPLSTILQGTIPAPNSTDPQGNVELFADSELATYDDVSSIGLFRTHTRTSFSGTLQNVPITVSSLNGNDWFTGPGNTYDTSYVDKNTSNTLAQTWFNDFFEQFQFDNVLTGLGFDASTIAAQRQLLFAQLRDQGGFQRMSDPNVSYVLQDDVTDMISIGLAGNQDTLRDFVEDYVKGVITDPFVEAAILLQLAGTNLDASEVVRVEYNGSLYYLRGNDSVNVNLQTTDPTESYQTNFNVTFQGIPEPASLSLLGMGAMALTRRGRRR